MTDEIVEYEEAAVIERDITTITAEINVLKAEVVKDFIESYIAQSCILDIAIDVTACYCMICIFFQRLTKRTANESESDN